MNFFGKMKIFDFAIAKNMAKKINDLNGELNDKDTKIKEYITKINKLEEDNNELKKKMIFMSIILSQSGTTWKITNKDGKVTETDESFMQKYKKDIDDYMKEYHIDAARTNSAPRGGIVNPYKNATHTYNIYNTDPQRRIENTYLTFDNGVSIYINRSICEFIPFDSIYNNLLFVLDMYNNDKQSVSNDFAAQCNYIIANEDKMREDYARIIESYSTVNWLQLFFSDYLRDSIFVDCVKMYIDYLIGLCERSIKYENDTAELMKFWLDHDEVNEYNALHNAILAASINPFEFQAIMEYENDELVELVDILSHVASNYNLFTPNDILDYRDLYINIINDINAGIITEQDIQFTNANGDQDPIYRIFGIDDIDEIIKSGKENIKKESEEDIRSIVSIELKNHENKKVSVHYKMTDAVCNILNLRDIVERFYNVLDLDYSKVSKINYEHLTLNDIKKNKIFDQIKSYIKFVITDYDNPQKSDMKSKILYDQKLVDRIRTLIQTEPFMFLFCFKFNKQEAIDLISAMDQYNPTQQMSNNFNKTNIDSCVKEYEDLTGQVAFYADTESNEKKFIKRREK